MKRICAIALALVFLAGMIPALAEEPTPLSYSDAVDIATIQSLDGKPVTIVGYMATLSPVSGEFMYLMDMPYQSCPFCKPNTTQLTNTMAVYAKSGKSFDFTDQAIRVTGTLEVGAFTDEYGYQYEYRIVDATYETVDLSAISPEYALYLSLAGDGVLADIYSMFDYLYFLCQWTEYSVSYDEDDGTHVFYYLYDTDVDRYLQDDGPYGYARYVAEDYFPGLVSRVEAVSATELTELTDVLAHAKEVEQFALSELMEGHYQYDEANDRFVLDNSQQLLEQYRAVYLEYDAWLSRWSLSSKL